MKLSVRETETIMKILTPVYCPITKASSNSHFHSSHFLLFIFPANISDSFSLCYLIKNNCVQSHDTTRTAPRVVRSTKLSPFLRDSYLDGWPETNSPCGNNFFLFHSLSKAILKTAELPSLAWCLSFYSSAICSSFRHVRIRVYIYNIVQSYKYKNSQTRCSNSSQFSWLLVV